MKKVVLYSPGVSSTNLGDHIIVDAAKDNLDFILKEAFVAEVATHLPMSKNYMRHLKNMDYKFVCGSNLLKSTFFGFQRQWDITLRLANITGPCILVGAGWWQYGNKPNLYTKILLKKMLSDKYIHSVRDEYTKKTLNSIGINNVINTSCPTMWKLTKEHCSSVPTNKAKNVIFTLTDYNKDKEKDKLMVKKMIENYDVLYFWPQGTGDYEYINELTKNKKIKIITPSVEAFNKVLVSGEVDYIGTRLHGGIRALQKKVRTIIVGIDNRAREKSKDFNIPIIEREDILKLDDLFINNNEFITKINIPEENIEKWKKQFVNK